MTLLTPEQFAAANKAQFETLFGLTNKAFEGLEKLLELNLQVVKSTLAESQENAQRALSVKDAQELLALQARLAQPVAEKALSYGRHVYEIVSATQGEFTRVAEAQYEEQNRKVQTLVENVAKNAPAGSETAVAVMKSAITAANTTYETIHKASKQASCRDRGKQLQRSRYGRHEGCNASLAYRDEGCLGFGSLQIEEEPGSAGFFLSLRDVKSRQKSRASRWGTHPFPAKYGALQGK